MKRYQMTGRPLAPPCDDLVDHRVGDVFEADLDKDVEKSLVDLGALKVLGNVQKPKVKDEPKKKSDDE